MRFKTVTLSILLCLALILSACNGTKVKDTGNNSGAGESVNTSTPSGDTQPTAPNTSSGESNTDDPKTGGAFKTISDLSDEWNNLYKANEAAINAYDGMPIMELATPGLCFVTGIQYDMLNLDNKDGRFEGKLMLAGWPAFVEKSGGKLKFGYDTTREKDGFSPNDKAGDRLYENGSCDLAKGFYTAEQFSERNGQKLDREYCEFLRLPDGSMICIDMDGQKFDVRGEENPSSTAVYVREAKDSLDFVIGKAQMGTDFSPISFADKGNMTKDDAIAAFKAAGFIIDMTGGVKNGTMHVEK